MNAVGYLRLSTKDQSKSLEYQEKIVREYCSRNKLNILKIFRDNGQSSFSFERPNYIALENFIKKFKGKCQYIVVLDHDRFSRNLPEALLKIAELEKKHKINVISTNESIDIDPNDSEVFMKRAFEYLIANRELLTIKNRTRQGIRNAKENGRYLGRAPFGYNNSKNSLGDSTITINDTESIIVKKIFRDYELGKLPSDIHREVRLIGFTNNGHSAIKNILENCVYAGLIKVPAKKDIPERYVKGIHNEIISEKDFWHIQKLLKNKRIQHSRPCDDFPLRGVVKCKCGKNLTAGWTKGRKEYYLYYKCAEHNSLNIPGTQIHNHLENLLKKITLGIKQLHQLKNMVYINFEENKTLQKNAKKIKLNAIRTLKNKMVKLEDKFISDQINFSVYKEWEKKINFERKAIERTLFEDSFDVDKTELRITKLFKARLNLFRIYSKSTTIQKHVLIRILFRDTLMWEDGKFSASYFHQTGSSKKVGEQFYA